MNALIRLHVNSSQIRRLVGLLVLLAYALFLVVQHWQVFPYHDDWGYAVLSYVTEQRGFAGQNFSLQQYLAFLHDEYFNWTGRVLAFFIQIGLFRIGLDAVRIVQIVLLFLIPLLSLKVFNYEILQRAAIVWPILCFCALPPFVTVGGLYWFSASIAYVWGIVPLLLGAWRMRVVGYPDMLSSLLIAFAALFQEQMAIAALIFLATFAVVEWCRKSQVSVWRCAIYAIPSVMAAIAVVLSPGNFARSHATNRTGSLLSGFGDNFQTLGQYLSGAGESHAFLAILLILLATLLPDCLKGRLSRGHVVIITMAVVLGLVVLCLTVPAAGAWALVILLAAALIWSAVHGDIPLTVACCGMAALGSLLLLLVSPSVSGRSLLPFYFLMFVPASYTLQRFFSSAVNIRRWFRSFVVITLLVVVGAALVQTLNTYEGYALNQPVNQENQRQFQSAQQLLSSATSSELTPVLLLHRLPDDQYAETMPYERPLIEKWMKKFYELPSDSVLIWLSPQK
ncbi:DUF6056 family protein [Kushneria aurantia]|uniref:DUF6056 family protein n=1 Tax=Kushneria aurantia TaxID=504092 RepID=A0ABV6FZ25_9GAMM|nr:DUF6056 family protein [Kushneria aurantia]